MQATPTATLCYCGEVHPQPAAVPAAHRRTHRWRGGGGGAGSRVHVELIDAKMSGENQIDDPQSASDAEGGRGDDATTTAAPPGLPPPPPPPGYMRNPIKVPAVCSIGCMQGSRCGDAEFAS